MDRLYGKCQLIENAEMIFTVSGFSGFEAVIRGKPVVTFGKTFYDVLPDDMVRNVAVIGLGYVGLTLNSISDKPPNGGFLEWTHV